MNGAYYTSEGIYIAPNPGHEFGTGRQYEFDHFTILKWHTTDRAYDYDFGNYFNLDDAINEVKDLVAKSEKHENFRYEKGWTSKKFDRDAEFKRYWIVALPA